MIKRFLYWIFHTVAPYFVGIGLGVAFFVMLIHYLDSHGTLLQSAPGLAERLEQWTGSEAAAEKEKNQSHQTIPTTTLHTSAANAHIPGHSGQVAGKHHGDGNGEPGTNVAPPSSPVGQRVPQHIDNAPTTKPQQALERDDTTMHPSSMPAHREGPSPRSPATNPGTNDARAAAANRAFPVANQAKTRIEECGPPPLPGPNPDYERHMACQWRRNCQIHLENYQRMIEEGLRACPTHATHAPMCRNYYRSLQMQIPPQACDWPRLGTWP
ncbi:MAG: hypothetical protein HQL77_12110 [Magnetococcales bacterium]|nr:hypothetical protein [Magnetococcales bacterium]